jgi:uncharacterized protein involved in outer membrane biogenesis
VKKVLAAALLVGAVVAIGVFVWARSLFATDSVRLALAGQLSKALGQPVTVGGIGVAIYPRVTVNLRDVSIGEPSRIHAATLKVGTALGALLSRRIEHATIELNGAKLELPLPSFSMGGGETSSPSAGKPPVDLVSIDAIVLRSVAIVSGGRTVLGDIEIVPDGKELAIKKITLTADKTTVDVTGRLTDLAGPVGSITIKAGALNFDRLLAFASDFARGAGMGQANPVAASRPSVPARVRPTTQPMNVAVSLDADRATLGQLTLERVAGKARITSDALTLDPVGFGVFGGRYEGTLAFTLASVPDFRLNAAIAGLDVGAATAFAGNPGTITGRLSGKVNLSGRGLDAASVMRGVRGTLRVDVADGTVKNLGLVRTIVVATSGRSDATFAGASKDEPFTRLSATLAIANGAASTQDLRFESKDLLLAASGTMRLDGSAINLPGQVQLSEDLSKQAGRDLVRYTQSQGRVTLPVTVAGSATAPEVRVDVADLARRAVTNRANEEAQKALKKGLDGFLKKD